MYKLLAGVDIDKVTWQNFVLSNPYSNIFQTNEFLQSQLYSAGIEPFVFCVIENTEIVALVSGVILSNGGKVGKYFTSRAIVTGGPLVAPNLYNREAVLDFLLSEVNKKLNKSVIYVQFRNFWNIDSDKQIFLRNGFIFEAHLDILMDLRLSETDLLGNMTRDRKKSIKKGTRELEIRLITDFEKLFEPIYILLKTVYQRVKLPLPSREYFSRVIDTLAPEGNIKIFGAFKDNILIGVRLVLCYNKLVYDWYAGANDDYLEYRPNDILVWEVLIWGKENGYSTFDFGGAGKPNIPYGVRDYKLKFGGELVNFGRFELINKPILFFVIKSMFNLIRSIRGVFKRK